MESFQFVPQELKDRKEIVKQRQIDKLQKILSKKTIYEDLDFYLNTINNEWITDLGNIEEIHVDFYFNNCINLKSLSNLKVVYGNLNLSGCVNLESLGALEKVYGNLFLNNCRNLKSLGNLREVHKFLDCYFCSSLENLGKLEIVLGGLDLMFCTNLKSLGKLQECNELYRFRSGIFVLKTNIKLNNKI